MLVGLLVFLFVVLFCFVLLCLVCVVCFVCLCVGLFRPARATTRTEGYNTKTSDNARTGFTSSDFGLEAVAAIASATSR